MNLDNQSTVDAHSLLERIDREIHSPKSQSSAASHQQSVQVLGGVTEESLRDGKIIIVDDEPVNVKLIRKYLKEFGYCNSLGVTNALEAMEVITRENPDLVILDVMMPDIDGLQILSQLRKSQSGMYTPVLILTASNDRRTKLQALELGATDFLHKPVDISELAPRVRTSLITKRHQDDLANYADRLETAVRARTRELQISRQELIECLARAADYRDNDTGRHVLRVGRYSALIAIQLGWSKEAVELLEQAAPLHDIGKIGTPDSILLKPGKLTPEESAEMKKHAEIGLSIMLPRLGLRDLDLQNQSAGARRNESTYSPILQLAATIALTHHERWDGTGYPRGLAGEAIPMAGRITSVADVFDALSSKRPYKPAYPVENCLEILKAGRGTQFDPQVLDAFFSQIDKILATQIEMADPV